MGDLTKEERNTIVKEIKRLNERMRDMERKGLTDTISYQKLSTWVANQPNEVRDGYKRAIQTFNLTPAQAKRTHALAKNTQFSAGSELKRARRYLKAEGLPTTRADLIRQANDYGKLEEHVRTNLEKLYEHIIIEDTDKKFTQRRKNTLNKIMKDDMLSYEQKIKKFDEWYKRTWKFTTGD